MLRSLYSASPPNWNRLLLPAILLSTNYMLAGVRGGYGGSGGLRGWGWGLQVDGGLRRGRTLLFCCCMLRSGVGNSAVNRAAWNGAGAGGWGQSFTIYRTHDPLNPDPIPFMGPSPPPPPPPPYTQTLPPTLPPASHLTDKANLPACLPCPPPSHRQEAGGTALVLMGTERGRGRETGGGRGRGRGRGTRPGRGQGQRRGQGARGTGGGRGRGGGRGTGGGRGRGQQTLLVAWSSAES